MTSVALGEVAEFIRGVSFKPTDVVPFGSPGSVACMRTANVQSELDVSDVIAIPRVAVPSERQLLREGDILVSSANSWNLVGKCCWVPRLPYDAAIGGFVGAIRVTAHERVVPRYLYYWLASPRTQATLRNFGRKTTSISNLSIPRTLDMPVPLPSLAEQRRIADLLDQVDSLGQGAARAGPGLRLMIERQFRTMFGEEAAVSSDSRNARSHGHRVLLTEVARLATGHTPDRAMPAYWGGSIPWLTLSVIRHVDGRVVSDTPEHTTPAGIDNSAAVLLPPGTVCFSRTASVGFATILGREMCTSQDFVNWVCGPSLRPTYLLWAFVTSRASLRALASGSTHKTIYFPTVERFRVLVPSLADQIRFEALVSTAMRLEALASRRSSLVDELRLALPSKVFDLA